MAPPLPAGSPWILAGFLAAACGSAPTRPAAGPRPPREAPPLAPEAGAGTAAATSAPSSSAETTPAAGAPERRLLGEVAGQPLFAEDLLVEWGRVAGRDLWLLVDRMIATRLAFAEAARIGLSLPPEMVELAVAEEKRRLEADLRAAAGEDGDVDDVIRRELRRAPERAFDDLRPATMRRLIAERVVRSWTLSQESAAVRLVVVPTEAEAQEVLSLVRGGADLAELARERSVDETSAEGGLLAYLARQEHSPLARAAFATPIGGLAGPLAVSDHFLVLRVEDRRAALAGDWSVLRDAVESSLAAAPVKDAEFLHWKLAAERRHPIDLGPLMRVVGDPQ